MHGRPAEFAFTRQSPEGTATIWSCAGHAAATLRQLGVLAGQTVAAKAADPSVHDCKGCDAGWHPG